MKQSQISAAVREPMLSAGQVDAVTGFSYLSAVNLRDRGVPADDLAVLRYADYGCEAYGFALIVNPAFAAAKPDAVKGFLRAVIAGTHLAIKTRRARWMKSSAGWTADRAISNWSGCAPSFATTSSPARSSATASAASIPPASSARSIRSPRISNSRSGRRRRIFSTIASCPPLGGRLIN